MSDLSDLQPTIFFAMCTLKGVLWIPLYLLPELYLKGSAADAAEDAELYGIEPDETHDEALLQDHHVLLLERVCHYTNLFALVGLLSFYAVNPRLWQYQKYGWLLLALLLFQHLPQAALLHMNTGDGVSSVLGLETSEDETATTADMIMASNRIFSTVGVVIFQVYALVFGHVTTLKRLAAEPFFVYFALVTMLMETHVTCLSVWWCYGASAMMNNADDDTNSQQQQLYSHFSTAVSWVTRQILVGILMGALVGSELWYSKHHPEQLKDVRKQLRTVNAKPKMKFV